MILFSCWEHSEIKNSFMSLREIGLPRGCADAAASTPKVSLKHAELFLLFQLLCVGLFGRGLDRLGLLCARARVDVAILDVDEGFFAQRGQKGTQRRLQFLHVQRILDARLRFLQGGNARHLMLARLQDHVTLLGANHIRHFTGLQREDLIFQFFRERSALERTEVAAVFRRWPIGVLFRQVRKLCALVNLVQQILRLGLGRRQGCLRLSLQWWRGLQVWGRSRLGGSFRRDQNLAQPNLLGSLHLRAVLVIELLHVVLVHGQVRTHFLPNHALRDDLVAQVLLEVFIRSSLCLRRLFQFFHGREVHLLTHFIEALNKLCVAGDAKVFAFLQKELLVNQIAQNVALFLGESAVGVGGILLLDFLLQLIAAADVFRAGDDLVVHPGDNLFHHGVSQRKRWEQQRVPNSQQQGKSGFLH